MAITIPIISEFSDKGLKSAEGAFNTFKTEVGKAQGAMGKFKAGAGVAMDYVNANAGLMAATAGTAIATFAVKAIGDFQDLALSVDKFRDATGLSLDQASRWTEVAGDIGVDAGTIQTAINKMNKEAEKGAEYFEGLGVEMAKHKDGTYDPQQTFFNVIDRLREIKDPAEKATIATELLGKNWMDMADLIERGSGALQDSLAEVADTKIISEREVQNAQDLREGLDKLKDAFGEITLKVGEALIPALENALTVLEPLLKGLELIFPGDFLEDFTAEVEASIAIQEKWEGTLGTNRKALNDARHAIRKAADQVEVFDSNVDGLIDTWDVFLDRLNQEEAWDNLEEQLQEASDTAWLALAENTPEAWEKADDARRTAQEGVADYIKKIGDVPPEIQSKILTLVDQQKFDEVKRLLDELAKSRTVQYIPIRPGDTPSETTGRGTIKRSARADIFGPAQAGPNLLGTTAASTTGNITVNVMGSVTSEKDLVETIRKGLVSAQRNGAQLVYNNV